jgi:hypothetical protein
LRRAELCMNSGGGHFEQYAVQHNWKLTLILANVQIHVILIFYVN